MNKFLLFGVIIFVIVILLPFLKKMLGEEEESKKIDLDVYERKPFLFDAVSELNFYKMLLELYGDKYYIFTQVNYSHLIQPKKSTWQEERKQRSSIDRKSADFVLCEKERVVPQLIIELDGSVHNFKSKIARDQFIDSLTNMVDLPLLHIKTGNMDREFVKSEIDKKLGIITT